MSQAVRVEGARRVTQEMHEQEYQQALVTIKDKIAETEGPDMKETMQDQIRQWFIECRYALTVIFTSSLGSIAFTHILSRKLEFAIRHLSSWRGILKHVAIVWH